jgi:tetrahydromethanopterin S-methyltransferase subunit B
MDDDNEVYTPKDSDYQIIVDGKPVPITELTREQMITNLREMMDVIEDLDEQVEKMNNRIERWRYGR